MLKSLPDLIERITNRRELRRWRIFAARSTAAAAHPTELKLIRTRARQLKPHLDEALRHTDERLGLPLVGSKLFPTPLGTDWSWRPDLWRVPLLRVGMAAVANESSLGDQVKLYHDCARSELSLRQIRNLRESDLAPFGLMMDVFAFDGSFLSLVINMPETAVSGLRKTHLMRVALHTEVEQPIDIFVRLNIVHGPNTEQIVRELPRDSGDPFVEFDLAYTQLNEKRVERAWIDLIFEGPQMNQVILRDLTFARCPRAAF
ncbi:DUF6478 family protein [Pseudooceanicola sp. C21-150M6]|uniref:DUF6478 family protein n=1 Tax=Pseudooceanicola sp. C21-150M6 TaxID=3434355 RepID=UPI003D7F89CA